MEIGEYGGSSVPRIRRLGLLFRLMTILSLPSVLFFSCGGGGESPAPTSVSYAYVANSASNNVSVYTIDATTGALAAVAGSPFAAGDTPFSVAIGIPIR
jgi:DNA-binding beta-propeller fold protein YncE